MVPLTMAASSPFSGDHRALPVSMPPFCRRWTVSCPWLCIPGLPRRKLLVMIAFSTSLSARSFPPTPAHPGQYIHKSIRWWVTRTDTCQSGLHFHFELLLKAHRSYIGMGKHDPFPGLQSKLSLSFRSFRLAVQTLCRKRWLCGEQLWVLQRQVSLHAGILLLRQQQDLCGLWVVYLHFCGVYLCFTLSFCHWHTLCYTC